MHRGYLPLRALLGQLLSRCIRVLYIADIRHVYPDSRSPNRRHPHPARLAPFEVRDPPRDVSEKNREGVPRFFCASDRESDRNTLFRGKRTSSHSKYSYTKKMESHPSVRCTVFTLPALSAFRTNIGISDGTRAPPALHRERPHTPGNVSCARVYSCVHTAYPPHSAAFPKGRRRARWWRGHPKLISEEETRPEKGYPEARLSHDCHNATWPRRPPKFRRRRFPRRPMHPR